MDIQTLLPILLIVIALASCTVPLVLALIVMVVIWSRNSGMTPQLQSILLLLTNLPMVLRKTATALSGTSQALGLIQGNISKAGRLLDDVSDSSVINNFAIKVPRIETEPVAHTDFSYIRNLDLSHTENLDSLKDSLHNAGTDLQANADLIETVRTDLTAAANALNAIATALGSSQ